MLVNVDVDSGTIDPELERNEGTIGNNTRCVERVVVLAVLPQHDGLAGLAFERISGVRRWKPH